MVDASAAKGTPRPGSNWPTTNADSAMTTATTAYTQIYIMIDFPDRME